MFIVFYKPFVAECPPAGVFIFGKKHVPSFFEDVLLWVGPSSSILGSQEASYIGFSISFVGFESGR